MKIKFPKIKLKIKGKYIYIIIIILILLGLTLATLFIFNNLYRVMSYSEEIFILKQEIAPESFNVEDFNKAMEGLNKKQDQSQENDWTKISNPFRKEILDIQTESKPINPLDNNQIAPNNNPLVE